MASSFDEQYATALESANATLAGAGAPRQGMRRMGINFSQDADLMGRLTAPNDADAETRATLTRFGGRWDMLRGIGNALVGDQDEANALYARVREREARADAMDSDVSTDWKDWDSVGDVLAGTRKGLIQSGPDMALALGGAGLGRTVARRAAVGAEARALAQAPTRAVEDAAAARMARQRVQAATPEVAALQRQEALQQAARGAVRGDPAAMARVNRAGRVGTVAGGVAGGLPGQIAEQRQALEENPGQANAAKLLAASTGAAALDYLPLDRLMGRAFKNPALKQAFAEANPSLVRQLGRRAATAAKGVGEQALTEGLTEGAQAAIQRAGHKWVDNNVQLLSREALDDYVANAVGGVLLGSAMGAAVDVPQGVAGATADTGRWAWDRTGAARAKIRENLAKPWFRGQGDRPTPGKPMGPSGGPQPPSGGAPGSGEGTAAADLLQRVKDGLRSAGAQAQDLAGRARSAAAEGLQRTADALKTNRELDAQADAVMDAMDRATNDDLDGSEPIGARPGMAKGQFLRNWAVSKVAPEYLAQLGDSGAGHLGNALNHLASGKLLAAPQRALVVRALQSGALTENDYNTIRGVGPVLRERMGAMSRTAGDELGTLRSPQFDGQNPREVLDEDEDVDTGVEVLDEDEDVDTGVEVNPQDADAGPFGVLNDQGDRELPALDRANSARQGMRAASERGDVAGRTENRDAGRAAFAEARGKLLQGLTTDENRSSEKAAQLYDRRKAQAGFVELAEKVDKSDGRGKVMRGQLVNLAMLIKRQQNAMRAEGTADEDISPRAALLRGLSELAQAGAAVNLDTLTKGDIVATYQDKNGVKTRPDEHVMYLSARDIDAIKAARFVGPARHPGMERPVQGEMRVAKDAPIDEDALDKDYKGATRRETEDNREPDDDSDRGVLRARMTPPGEDAGEDAGKWVFTPSNSPVSSVSFNNPHAKRLNDWRRERDGRAKGMKLTEWEPGWERGEPSPHQPGAETVANINRRYGELIGADELAAELANGTISQARFDNQMARLRDPESQLALNYLKRAIEGKLQGGETAASVRHMKADSEAPAKGKRDDYSTTVDEETGEYQGKDEDLAKRADKNRRTASRLARPERGSAQARARWAALPAIEAKHEANKRRLTLSKAKDSTAQPEPSRGDGLGKAKKLEGKAAPTQDELRAEVARRDAVLERRRKNGLDGERSARYEAETNRLRKLLGEAPAPKDAPTPAPKAKKRVVKKAEASNADAPATDTAVNAAATTKPDAHDHVAEAGLVNALLRALGYDTQQAPEFTVSRHADAPRGGRHSYTRNAIWLGDALTGRERVEVLAHEVGHAVIAAEVSKATGVPVNNLLDQHGGVLNGDRWMTALRKANPTLFKALEADFRKWSQIHRPDTNFVSMRLGRSGPARGAAVRRGGRASGQGERTTGQIGDAAYQLSMNEWLADNIARALLQNKTGQSTVEKFFGKIAAQLKRAYDLLFKGKQAKRWAPAPSVEAWINGLFDANVAAVRAAEGQAVPKATADAAVTAATHSAANPPGSPPPPPRGDGGDAQPQGAPDEFNALREYIKAFLPPDARQILERAFSTAASDKIIRSTFEGIPEVTDLLSHASEGMDARIAAGYLAWRAGKFKGGPQSQSALRGMFDRLMNLFNLAGQGDYAQRILQDMFTGRVKAQREIRGGYNVRTLEAKARGNLQRALNKVVDVKDKVLDPFNRAMESNVQRMFESGIPAARKIAALLYKPQGYTGNDRGMLRDAVHQTALFADQAARIFNGLTARQQRNVINLLQRKATEADLNAMLEVPGQPPKPRYSEKTKQAVRDTRKLMADALDYMDKAGVRVNAVKDFFPVMMDISGEFDAQKLTKLLDQPHFEQSIRELPIFQERDEDGNTMPSSKPMDELVSDLVKGAASSPGPATTGSGVPNFTGANLRTMNFIYSKGTPEDIKTFASLQTKNPAEIFARYFEPMVKRAEYARRFGDDGKKLEALLEQMKEQGATEAQVAHARDAVAAALGTYGQELSPVLNQISPALAKKFSGDKTRATIDGLTAYQNARLLPLSLLSSLVDPAGIMVRAGGDAGLAWRGFRNGLRTLYSQSSREQLQDMLRLLGATSDMGTVEHLNQMHGGAGSKFSQKVNEMVFKWNGMSAWVRATRYMALNAAHEFLLKHGRGANEHSARYLAELGVKAEDIQTEFTTLSDGQQRALVKLLTPEQRAAADKAEVDRDDRVRQALMDFVDGAILRPNTQQVPQWHNDPFMRLITQYKSFGYAFYDQIMGRLGVEMRNGNHKVLLAAAAYMPVVIMAEMLRNVLQGDEEDTEDWGPYEWVQMGAERSGFVAPKLDLAMDTVEDVQNKRLPGSSNIGPTPSQARNVAKALQGQRDLGKEFESALPGSALWRKWNDESRGGVAGDAT